MLNFHFRWDTYVSPCTLSTSVSMYEVCMPVYLGWEVLCIDRSSSKMYLQLSDLVFCQVVSDLTSHGSVHTKVFLVRGPAGVSNMWNILGPTLCATV